MGSLLRVLSLSILPLLTSTSPTFSARSTSSNDTLTESKATAPAIPKADTIHVVNKIDNGTTVNWQTLTTPSGTEVRVAHFETDKWNAAASSLGLSPREFPSTENTLHSRTASAELNERDDSGITWKQGCYSSGSWAFQSTLIDDVPYACNVIFNSDAGPGSTLVAEFKGRRNVANDLMSTFITQTVHDSMSLDYVKKHCIESLTAQIHDPNCAGKHGDTRGGNADFFWGSTKILSYNVDPTTYNCMC